MALREEILRKPLGLFFTKEELEIEKEHVHIAGFLGQEMCATAVLVPDGDEMKMQRVALKAPFQGKGPVDHTQFSVQLESILKVSSKLGEIFGNSLVERTYTGDYEVYGDKFSDSPQEVEVYIAIEQEKARDLEGILLKESKIS